MSFIYLFIYLLLLLVGKILSFLIPFITSLLTVPAFSPHFGSVPFSSLPFSLFLSLSLSLSLSLCHRSSLKFRFISSLSRRERYQSSRILAVFYYCSICFALHFDCFRFITAYSVRFYADGVWFDWLLRRSWFFSGCLFILVFVDWLCGVCVWLIAVFNEAELSCSPFVLFSWIGEFTCSAFFFFFFFFPLQGGFDLIC